VDFPVVQDPSVFTAYLCTKRDGSVTVTVTVVCLPVTAGAFRDHPLVTQLSTQRAPKLLPLRTLWCAPDSQKNEDLLSPIGDLILD